ncbi:hypothetical protein ABEB36_000267 [Hypothenemus hampei]|uniref:Myb/SANT-like DNA-binding domain-containing protein n=1 Tax=Hypothenemus hampei TaxID=57062 RepID=A0ABD1FEB8_HYPHA
MFESTFNNTRSTVLDVRTTQENTTEKFKWNHVLTKTLVHKRSQREKDFNRPKCKKIKLWHEIAKEVNEECGETRVSGEECNNKYRNLLKRYKNSKKKANTSGEEPVTWEYFNDFNEILGCKAAISPPENMLLDTLAPDEDDTSSSSTVELPQNITEGALKIKGKKK